MADVSGNQGIGYKGPAGQATASDKAVEVVSDHVERMWSATLTWSSSNPVEFFAVIALIAFALYQRRIRLVMTAGMKQEYADARKQAQDASKFVSPTPTPPQLGHAPEE